MSNETEYLSVEEVCARLHRAGIDTKTVSKVFAARLEPENLAVLGKDIDTYKGVIAVPEPGGRVYLVLYRFGTGAPLPTDPTVTIPQETGPDLRPRFISVNGPYVLETDAAGAALPGCEVLVKAKELTA